MDNRQGKNTWKKVLYEKQNFPDDYTDGSFLQELQKNLNVRTYSYETLVCASTDITLQLSSAVLFVTVYFNMEDGTLSPWQLWLLSTFLLALGYLTHVYLCGSQEKIFPAAASHLKTFVLYQSFSAALSPLLVSLTETISTDTIYFMTTIMLLANLLFFSYQAEGKGSVPGAFSLNAAVFASVCLASRLHCTWHAFITVTVAFELFALWPVLRWELKRCQQPSHGLVLTGAVVTLCGGLLGAKSTVGLVLYLLASAFITLLCPLWFFRLQPLKNNIYGPWDEAVIKDKG